ncbi:hypothetical protein CDEN61S_03403 [Castellaniella denitrificans]
MLSETQRARQARQQGELFERGGLGGQGADLGAAAVLAHLLQAGDHGLQRVGPGGLVPLAVAAAHHRVLQAVLGVQAGVGEAVAVADPAFVDRFVLEGHHAQHAVHLGLHHQVGAHAVVRADRAAPGQFPGAGVHAERLGQQRAHRADVDHVARQLGFHGLAHEGGDFGEFAPVQHADFHVAADFLAHADAAGAMDAALHLFGRDQRAHGLVEDHALGLLVARGRFAIAHGQVLQLALAALVADRAIQRVVDQQEFHDRALGVDGLGRAGVHHHAVGDRRRTGRQGLGGLFDFDQAHPAIGGDAELLVIAEMGDVQARRVGSLDDHAAFCGFDLKPVDGEFYHGVS